MFVSSEKLEKNIVLDCEPEPRFTWKIKALNFSDLEEIDKESGLFPVYGATVAQLLKAQSEGLRMLSDSEKDALQAINTWSQNRNALIVFHGVIACGEQTFDTSSDVKAYFLMLRPLSVVREVIDELAKKILEFSDLCDCEEKKRTH